MGRINHRRKQRKLKNNIILFVDGHVEKRYFNHININRYKSIKFKIKIGDELDYIRNYKDEVGIMVILDIDGITERNDPKKRFNNISKIINHDNVFYNNFSFEGFLLHHVCDFNAKILSSNEYDQHMRDEFGVIDSWSRNKNINNSDKILNKVTKETMEAAIIRSKSLNNHFYTNPSSNMNKLFDRLEVLEITIIED